MDKFTKVLLVVPVFLVSIWISLQVSDEATYKGSLPLEQSRKDELVNFFHKKGEEYNYFDYSISSNKSYNKEVIILTSDELNQDDVRKEISNKIKSLKLEYTLTIHQRDLDKLKQEKKWGKITSSISEYLKEELKLIDIQVLRHVEYTNSKQAEIKIKNYSGKSNAFIKSKAEDFLKTNKMKELYDEDSYKVSVVKV